MFDKPTLPLEVLNGSLEMLNVCNDVGINPLYHQKIFFLYKNFLYKNIV